MAQLHLLPEEVLIKTGPVDHADWNFRPILGSIQRSRFRLMLDLLEGHHFDGSRSGIRKNRRFHARAGAAMSTVSRHRCPPSPESVGHSLRKLDLRASLPSGAARRACPSTMGSSTRS